MLGLLALFALPACEPPEKPQPEPSPKCNNVVIVRVWRTDGYGAPYSETKVDRDEVGAKLPGLMSVAWADSMVRMEVIQSHCDVDPLPVGTPPACQPVKF